MKFSKKIVTLCITLVVIFTVAVFTVFMYTGNEPATLITAFFSFITIELWSLAGVTKIKVKNGSDEGEETIEEEEEVTDNGI